MSRGFRGVLSGAFLFSLLASANPGARAAAAVAAEPGVAVMDTASIAPSPSPGAPDTLTFGSLPAYEAPSTHLSFLGRHPVRVLVASATLAAASLIASQVLLHAADSRYDEYLATSDVNELQRLYAEARSRDRWSNALLVSGETLAAATVVLAWYELGAPAALRLEPRVLHGGAALQLRWGSR